MDVAIVKYNAGNIYSVVNAMKRLGISPILTDDAETLRKADRVLFPGQGQAREAMLYLKAHGLDETIKSLTQPVWIINSVALHPKDHILVILVNPHALQHPLGLHVFFERFLLGTFLTSRKHHQAPYDQ